MLNLFNIFDVQNNNMRKLLLLSVLMVFMSACIFSNSKRVKGNGNIIQEDRTGLTANKIKLAGFMDVEITQGSTNKVVVEADDNLQQYIITEMNEDDVLEIRMRNNISFITDNNVKIIITTTRLDQLTLSGSGNITGMNKFTGSDKVRLRISGVGDIKLDLNTPELDADISGSGSLKLTGETRETQLTINGVGDCDAAGLKTEKAKVKISGSGDAKIFAEESLDVTIRGVGSVYYKGAAAVTQSISGSGEIKRLPEE